MTNNWRAPQRPNAYAENTLIASILDGTFPPGSTLPAERSLAAQLGVTRPTLREAIQRLARDGWLTVRQGKPTAVNDFWQEGGLNVLSALVHHSDHLPPNFVSQLLEVRMNLAPSYTYAAIKNNASLVSEHLSAHQTIADTPEAFAAYDWQLHRRLCLASGNPIYTLILNGFADFYEEFARQYFFSSQARAISRDYYKALAAAAAEKDADRARNISEKTMLASLQIWDRVNI
ncbi:MAG: fatty acid metabolism transcriptional regulator FadR [Candidatus Promineifilaceae bacterium]|nr:fatty acid metabolism transcriptional regulator FadR [Candidatus Promineifilaceae bacterium]